ncbi:hypothetical protein BBJ28_00016817 [Nothophytophthora sp. Chile5]|nr:hypothetical protein BBJ28_00016817 [Nothophytophthora sp. Chile5]
MSSDRSYRSANTLYDGQDYSRQVEKKFGELSGKVSWQLAMEHLQNIKESWLGPQPTLNELVREDVSLARSLFRDVLQRQYPKDMGMWNKWGKWKSGNCDLVRMIFSKASRISFDKELCVSWASTEMETKNLLEANQLFKVILAQTSVWRCASENYPLNDGSSRSTSVNSITCLPGV